MRRRDVLRLLAVCGAVGATYQAVKLADGMFPLGRGGKLLSRTMTGMGTYVSISVVDPSTDRAEDAVGKAFQLMDQRERLLSRFLGDSALSELNSAGRLVNPPADLTALLHRSGQMHQWTNAAFDPTVTPLLDLYSQDFGAGRRPSDAEISERMELVGFAKVAVSDREVALSRSGMTLTLDGIAKGYIADAMAESLKQDGIKHGLINAGGDIIAFGGRGPGQPWKIAVRDPRKENSFVQTFDVMDGACATSGSYEVYFDKDKLYHHIIDPATGHSPERFSSSTVLAETATDADGLATSLLVAGRQGAEAIRRHSRGVLLLSDTGERVTA